MDLIDIAFYLFFAGLWVHGLVEYYRDYYGCGSRPSWYR